MNERDNESDTPLHLAVENGNMGIVQKLLAHTDIIVNTQNNNGLTLLHLAIQRSDYNIVKLLLIKGANVNDQSNPTRLTPLHCAIFTYMSEELKIKIATTLAMKLLFAS